MVKAEGLLPKDKGGTSDPFAELKLGSQVKKTKVAAKTLNPVWNETFDFDVAGLDSLLSIVIYDEDKGTIYGSSKEYLGSIDLPMREIMSQVTIEKW